MMRLTEGATYSVLRLYYVQAVRSLVDYNAPALTAFSPHQQGRLEVLQKLDHAGGTKVDQRVCHTERDQPGVPHHQSSADRRLSRSQGVPTRRGGCSAESENSIGPGHRIHQQ